MRTHPTFYVGRLRPYHSLEESSREMSNSSCQGQGEIDESRDEPIDVQHQVENAPHTTRSVGFTRMAVQSETASRHDLDPLTGRSCTQETAADTSATEFSSTEPLSVQSEVFPPPPPPLVDAHGHKRWIVAKLIDHKDQVRGRQRTRKFRVRWLGYPPSADTWEPRDNLNIDVPDLVADYEAKLS